MPTQAKKQPKKLGSLNRAHGEYERKAATKGGRRFLADHPEAQTAHVFAAELALAADRLASENLSPKERRRLTDRIVAARLAWNHLDRSYDASRRALVAALEMASEAEAKQVGAGAPAARMMLRADLDPRVVDATTGATIDAAIVAWAKRRKSQADWDAINALANALACGADDTETLRKKLVAIASMRTRRSLSPGG